MVAVEVLGQPLGLGGKPGAIGVAAAGLIGALGVERDEVPRAQVVGVPAVAGVAEGTGLALGLRRRLRDDVAGGRVGHRLVDLGAVAGVLDAVVVVEVAEAAHAGLAVAVIELVIARRGTLEELERAPTAKVMPIRRDARAARTARCIRSGMTTPFVGSENERTVWAPTGGDVFSLWPRS
jgi:hypothetical protein